MITSFTVNQLKSRFRGELIVPGDPQYDAARAVFNVTIDRRPALIARCAGQDDVMQAVNFARQENWSFPSVAPDTTLPASLCAMMAW